MLLDWSPIWLTQPHTTSSMIAGSTPVRSTSAVSTSADRSCGCTPAREPLRLPIGVRMASTMTASGMTVPLGCAIAAVSVDLVPVGLTPVGLTPVEDAAPAQLLDDGERHPCGPADHDRPGAV